MHTRTCIALLLAVAAGGAVASEPNVPLAEPVEYAHAGIQLALPEGFEPTDLSDSFEVLQAIRRKSDEPIHAVSLSAFPVAEKVTPRAFGDAMIADMRNNLAIRGLEVGKLVNLKVAGVPAAARRLTYRSRGVPSVAVGACFIREPRGDEPRLAYVLLVQVTPKDEQMLVPMFVAVVKSAAMIGLRHPADLPVGGLGRPHEDFRLGFSIRPPAGWYVAAMPKGVEMARTDYLLGGLPMPQVRVVVDERATREPAEKACGKALVAAKAASEQHKLSAELVREGPVSLGGVKGYGFVMRQGAKGPRADGDAMLLQQRTICVPSAEGGQRQYTVVMLAPCRGEEIARKTMDMVCESFQLLQAAETRPAETKPAATRPSSTRPATAPAVGTEK